MLKIVLRTRRRFFEILLYLSFFPYVNISPRLYRLSSAVLYQCAGTDFILLVYLAYGDEMRWDELLGYSIDKSTLAEGCLNLSSIFSIFFPPSSLVDRMISWEMLRFMHEVKQQLDEREIFIHSCENVWSLSVRIVRNIEWAGLEFQKLLNVNFILGWRDAD